MKKYNPNIHHRRSIRLKGYDYSKPGLYFITICVKNRVCLYGDVIDGKMKLNHAGNMVENHWLLLPKRFSNIKLHNFIVMPNHFHGILEIVRVGATLVVAPTPVAPNESNTPVAPNESNTPVVPNESNTPVVPNESNTPVVPNESSENVVFDQKGATTRVAPKEKTVGDMVGAFQSITTVEYIRGVKTKNWKPFDGKLWQRNYWERIIRDKKSYQNISKYILNNPSKWEYDKFKR